MLKVKYTVWQKNRNRGDLTYWCRVRESGQKPRDVNLHTKDKVKAEAYIRVRQQELELYNSYELAGEDVPTSVASKVLRRNTPVAGSERPCTAVVTRTALIDEFEKDLRRRGCRERTIEQYTKSVARVLPSTATLAEFSRSQIRDWLSAYNHLKTATRKSYSVALRELCKFLTIKYDCDRRILDDWPITKVESSEKGFWTMQQINKIIEHVECKDNDVEKCYKAYFWFMATTGARQGEAGLVEWRDINDNVVTFRAETTKTNKTRRVPLEWRIADMLARLPHDSKLVFARIAKGQAGRYAVLARAVKAAGVPHGGLHTFRHSASMYLYSHIDDIKAVSQILGHSASTALQYYQASRQSDQLRELVDKSYEAQNLLPDPMDNLLENDLI